MWISQLSDATEHNLGDVGRNSEDVEALQQEHEKLEATARVRKLRTGASQQMPTTTSTLQMTYLRRKENCRTDHHLKQTNQ